MGYITTFEGQFQFNKVLDDKTYHLLVGLATTRRVMRRCRREEGYGVDAEFYIGDGDYPKVVDDNKPPRGQPSLWLDWIPTEDRKHLKWNGGGPFHAYVKWLEHLQNRVLRPAAYWIDGVVTWKGDETEDDGEDDTGRIVATRGVIEARADGYLNTALAYDSENLWGNSAYGKCWDHGYVNSGRYEDEESDEDDDGYGWDYDGCPSCSDIRKSRRLQRKNDNYYEGLGPDDPKPKARRQPKAKRKAKVKRDESLDIEPKVECKESSSIMAPSHNYGLRSAKRPKVEPVAA